MRFALVAMIWLVLVGGLSLYTWQRDRRPPPPVAAEAETGAPAEEFVLEITPSFATAGDPFALAGDPAEGATLLARTATHELFRSAKPLPAGTTQRVRPVPGLVQGHNEIFVRAVPPVNPGLDYAVRVRLMRGGRAIVDQTLWGEKGAVVAGTVPFELKEEGEGAHHER